ncbi:helix-turn-helix domain-containing protein [Cellulosimicrobium sp. Marseille-Q4280]|uniref:AraC family transcriptional regulator n=1 Tax=Cellulosimicrobium sp. Marseille-Q4280 TaxID=2937992 RepID=UPI00203ACBDF|nr:helix-turn-helix domain-containing protein [Cellulosimicrobium sp. Marseille-Q4280]
MSFLYEERAASSPAVDVVWATVDLTDGTYVASADARWDLVFTVHADTRRVLLSGPSSKPTPVPYLAGNHNLGVRFSSGTYFAHEPVATWRDRTDRLSMPSPGAFLLAGDLWPFPSVRLGATDVDRLVAALSAAGVVRHDDVVEAALDGGAARCSVRTVERHFARAVGIAPRRVRQIERAREAVARLQEGRSIADVAYRLGYADQAHLTRDLKRLTGHTPGRSRERGEPV